MTRTQEEFEYQKNRLLELIESYDRDKLLDVLKGIALECMEYIQFSNIETEMQRIEISEQFLNIIKEK